MPDRPDAGISKTKDLEGNKVGVRSYSVTIGVLTRVILMDEYSLDLSNVTWIVDDEEHVPKMHPPPNVMEASPGCSLVSMMMSDEISACMNGNAGLGRSGTLASGWESGQAPFHIQGGGTASNISHPGPAIIRRLR